jgi:hypothetical protein
MMPSRLPRRMLGIAAPRTFIVLAISLGLASLAYADSTTKSDEVSLDETKPSAEPLPYQDRIIASDKLPPLAPDEDEEDASDGLPRSLRAELVVLESRQVGVKTRESGVSIGGFWDTENWGSFSADASVFRGDRTNSANAGEGWRGSATLWQRGLNMPGNWSVNNGLGVLNTPLPNLLREQYRFFLPSVPMFGLSSEWLRQEDGVQIQAAAGRGGVYEGSRLSGFETGDGSVASLGAQWAWAPEWTGAVSLLATDGRIVPNSQGLPQFQNGETRALLFGNRWQGSQDSVTFNVQSSQNDAINAMGAWLDARSVRGAYSHRYGFFYLEPDLVWGAFPINNDVRGAYYRIDYQRARWSWNSSLDRIESISGRGFDGWFGNAYLRYQASPRIGYGGGVSVRDSDTASAQSLQLFVDAKSRIGQTRFQYDQANDSANADSWQVLVDHNLLLKEGARLSLSAGFGELASGGNDSTRTASLAAYGGIDLTDNFSIDGTVRLTHDDGPDRSRLVDANIALQWRLATRWSLLGNFSATRGSSRSPFILDPLGNPVAFQTLPSDRSAYISLRYQFNAGKSPFVIGGSNSAGSGRIVGTLFLDENADGVRSATEQAAVNITVLLDDRYTVRTDQQGRFQFDQVAVGSHTISVVSDNLPLPWFIDEDNVQRRVNVEVRRDTVLDIAAIRQR